MDRPTALPGDNRLSSRERHPSRPCPEGTFLDSPGFVRSTTLGCGPVQKISPEGAGLIGVLRETVGRIVTCFGSSRSNATAVPIAPCVKRTPLGFNGHNGCPPPRVAAARQPWAMEDFPFREWLGRMVVRVGHAVIFGWMNWVLLRRSPTQWAAMNHGSAKSPPLDVQPQHPRHRQRAGVHPILLHPEGGEGPRRGDEGATRAAGMLCVTPRQTTRAFRPHPNPLPQSSGFCFSGVVWWERGSRAAVPLG